MKNQTLKNTVFYIENLGDQTLGDELMQLEANGAKISLHLLMKCFDRQGNPLIRNLYEVPADVKDKVVMMAKKAGFMYRIYSRDASKPDNLPKEFVAQIVAAKPQSPFAGSMKKRNADRKKLLLKLPLGVFTGKRFTSVS